MYKEPQFDDEDMANHWDEAQAAASQRIADLEAALAVERARATEAILAREALWRHYRRCTEALGLTFDQVPENPEKELEMWRGMRAKVTELERDRERLDWLQSRRLRADPYGQSWLVEDKVPKMDGSHVNQGRTLREAIDAAREAAKG